jgi:2-keto-3-deoxy-L-rhamnonate aldolase RhmA
MISFKTLLSSDRPFFGTFIQSASPEFLEASAYAGFRFAAIDLEHASFGTETLVQLIRAGEAAGLSMLARVPGLDAALIKKSLDMGASGIIVPNIDTPEQAEKAVALCRFTPDGIRGACPGVRANRYGAGGSEYYENANRETVVIPLIESPVGVENYDQILAVPGISAVFLGPIDLSVALGLKGNVDDPRVQEMLVTCVKKAKAANVPVGALSMNYQFIRELLNDGLDFLAYGIDTILMYHMCREIVETLQEHSEI